MNISHNITNTINTSICIGISFQMSDLNNSFNNRNRNDAF